MSEKSEKSRRSLDDVLNYIAEDFERFLDYVRSMAKSVEIGEYVKYTRTYANGDKLDVDRVPYIRIVFLSEAEKEIIELAKRKMEAMFDNVVAEETKERSVRVNISDAEDLDEWR